MKAQIFSMDLLITVLIIMLILPFMVYINYQINFKQVHIKKVGIIIERYYTFANIISYVCLAKINSTYGKILPNYIDYENSVMWAVRLNITQGLTKNESLAHLCVKIFGYDPTVDSDAIKHCVEIFSIPFDICKEIDTRYRWFLTDRFGKIIFVSYKLNKTNDYRVRLCLSDAWQRFTYGYGNKYIHPVFGACDSYLIENQYEVIHVPFVGIARTKQPIWFLDTNDNLRLAHGININNFNNMEEIPVGFISSDFLLYIFNKTPPKELENNIVIDVYTDAIPVIFTDVKAGLFATDECTTNMAKVSDAVNIIYNLQSKIPGLVIYTYDVNNIYAYNPRCKNPSWHPAGKPQGYSPGPVVPNPFINTYSSADIPPNPFITTYSSLADIQNIINNANSVYIENSGTYYIVVLDWLYYNDVNNLVNRL